jgi:hypothetical protein
MNTDKKYHKEVAVSILLMFILSVSVILMTLNDFRSMDKFCANNPSQCQPAIYPGKVIEND